MQALLLKSKYGKALLAFVLLLRIAGFCQVRNDNQCRDSVISGYCTVCENRRADAVAFPLFSSAKTTFTVFADIDFHRAHVLVMQGREDSAYRYLISALHFYEMQPNDSLLYFAHMLHAFILYKKQLRHPALEEYQTTLRIGERLHLPLRAAIQADVGMLYYELGSLDSAYAWYKTAMSQPEFTNSRLLQRNVFNNLAIYYLYKKDYRQAEAYHLESLRIKQALNDTQGMAESYLNLGDLYYDEYRDSLARHYWIRSLQLATRLRHLALLQMVNYNLSEVARSGSRYKEALRYYRLSIRWKDSIWNRDKVWTLGQQQKQLAVREKQWKIFGLERTVAAQQMETSAKRRERNAFMISSLMLLLVACMSVILYRYKVKATRQLKALNQTKDRLFSVIAHDMRAPLTLLAGKNNRMAPLAGAIRNRELTELVNEVRLGLTSVQLLLDNLLYWSFSETGNLLLQTRTQPAAALIRQAAAHLELQMQSKQVNLCYDVPQEIYILGDSYTLKMIFRNLLQNAVKFSYPGQCVQVALFREAATCRIEIRDQGCGIPAEVLPLLFAFDKEKSRPGTAGEPGSGLGLWLCQDFIRRNKGNLRLENHPEGGAHAIIHIPLAPI